MIISVVNKTKLKDKDVLSVITAINRQINEHFLPYWSMGATLRLEGTVIGEEPDSENLADLRGDAILYLCRDPLDGDFLGFHERNHRGIPFGFVFTSIAKELGEDWSVTLSHEALELVADPEVNLLVKGPHPEHREREVFHWYEMCDAVQGSFYKIDGINVSNFLLPLYFTLQNEPGSRNDFLGVGVPSFGVAVDGYIGFFDPELNDDDQFFANRKARARMAAKDRARLTRRSTRYKLKYVDVPSVPSLVTGTPVFESFAVKFSAASPKSREASIQRVLGRGWTIEEFSKGHSGFVKVVPITMTLTVAEAWELAHRLRREAGIETAEPLFDVEFSQPKSATQPDGVRGFALFGGDKPGTEDHEWAIKRLKVPEARQATGTSGKGVVIAHPDTGFTKHPEIWPSQPPRQIDVDRGFDFVANDANPEDDLVGGFGNFPSHGTGTASVIMSAALPSKIIGVAPLVKLIPLRVSNSVIHLSMTNVTNAIHKAVDEGAHIISMSLGGIPSASLHEAVVRAVDEGIILIAASGNFVGVVVWPAAFDEVIALAATNIEDKPWLFSSRGEAVDVSAPGESVWRALTQNKPSGPQFIAERSSGTSFATAHTAGIAALWLEVHGREALIAKYGKRGLVEQFKALLMKTSRRPADWDSGRFGAGIVDAEALLKAPLPPAAPRGARLRARATSVTPSADRAALLDKVLANTGGNRGIRGRIGPTSRRLQTEFGDELAFHALVAPPPGVDSLQNASRSLRAALLNLDRAAQAKPRKRTTKKAPKERAKK